MHLRDSASTTLPTTCNSNFGHSRSDTAHVEKCFSFQEPSGERESACQAAFQKIAFSFCRLSAENPIFNSLKNFFFMENSRKLKV
jgi:hypothetical protein